jgi:hypothetical protein
MIDSRLRHLVLVPQGGLCNRQRAIAAAYRICTLNNARCTVVWDWGDYSWIYEPSPVSDWIPRLTPQIRSQYHHIKHLLAQRGGSAANRRIPVTTHPKILLFSHYVFNALEEAAPIGLKHFKDWLPKPASIILEKTHAFSKAHFQSTVGMHIRRTDHGPAKKASPDALFVAEAEKILAAGQTIFLATDNERTARMMKHRFASAILIYPKNPELRQRWPRKKTRQEDVFEDMIDLYLLAACEYVLGSAGSSFSEIAMLLNGSVKCRKLALEDSDPKKYWR